MVAFFFLSCLINSALSILLGVFVLWKANNKLNRLWALTCFSIALWSLGIAMMVHSHNMYEALFWQNFFLYPSATFIPVFYLHFVCLVTEKKSPLVISSSYFIAIVLAIISLSGKLSTVLPKSPFNYYTEPLLPFHYFTIFFFTLVILSHYFLWQRIKASEIDFRPQLKLLFGGTLLGFIGGSTSFFMTYNIRILPYGVCGGMIYVFVVYYAISRYNLLNIQIFIRRTVIYTVLTVAVTVLYGIVISTLTRLSGGKGLFSSIGAAAVITLAFLPILRRVQRFVDRYFFKNTLDENLLQEMTRGIAHEIRRPLANIAWPAEMTLVDIQDIQNGKIPFEEAAPKIRERLEYMIAQSKEASHRIESIRAVVNPAREKVQDVNLAQLVRESLVLEKDRLDGIDLEVNVPDDLVINARPKQLEIVFVNLIRNAAQAMNSRIEGQATTGPGSEPADKTPAPRASALIIRAWGDSHHAMISFKDNGPGVPSDVMRRMFDPYFTTKGAKGMGVGLFLVNKIIKTHDGSVDVKTSEAGAEFIIRLPK
jgi:signal transduction histidine kinase